MNELNKIIELFEQSDKKVVKYKVKGLDSASIEQWIKEQEKYQISIIKKDIPDVIISISRGLPKIGAEYSSNSSLIEIHEKIQKLYPEYIILNPIGLCFEIWEGKDCQENFEEICELLSLPIIIRKKSMDDAERLIEIPVKNIEQYIEILEKKGKRLIVLEDNTIRKEVFIARKRKIIRVIN